MMPTSKTSITIQDVAQAAGVSVSTVSRVLNAKGDVAPHTYEKVQRVIQELNYTSSLAARSMRSRRTNVIGVVARNLTHSFVLQILKGIERGINEFSYDLIVYTTSEKTKSELATWERHHIALLNSGITDGIIVVAPRAADFPMISPIVAIDLHNENSPFPAVIATNRAGALEMVAYLISLGHRRIGFISGRADLMSGMRRLQGYTDSLLKAGLPIDPELIQAGDYSRQVAFDCAQKLLRLPNRPTAVFAANDESAKGVLEAAALMGLRVPEDLSVAGFDNIPESAYLQPPLTTVDQSIETMGYLATKMLVELIMGQRLECNLRKVPTRLIIRESCRKI